MRRDRIILQRHAANRSFVSRNGIRFKAAVNSRIVFNMGAASSHEAFNSCFACRQFIFYCDIMSRYVATRRQAADCGNAVNHCSTFNMCTVCCELAGNVSFTRR